MAVARFQVVRPAPSVRRPAAREQGLDAGTAQPREAEFAWRFMTANNRCLAKSAQTCPDVKACLAAIRTLQEGLPRTVGETARNGNGQWVWRARLAGEVVAIAARTYQQQLRARLMCDLFLKLATQTVASAPVQVIHR